MGKVRRELMTKSMVKWTSRILFGPLMLFDHHLEETGGSFEIVSYPFLIAQVSNAHCRKVGE